MPTDKGAHTGLKVSSLVAGMAAGADSFKDMALLRHGGMGKVFTGAYAPSTLGSFLRAFTFGHVRQADAVASRFLPNLAEHTDLLGGPADTGPVLGDLDDTIVEIHGYSEQGAAFGYSGVRGPQCPARHRLHRSDRAGDRGPAAAQGQRGLRAAGHRHPCADQPQPAGRPGRAAAGGLGVLLPHDRRPTEKMPGRPAISSRPSTAAATSPDLTGARPARRWIEVQR